MEVTIHQDSIVTRLAFKLTLSLLFFASLPLLAWADNKILLITSGQQPLYSEYADHLKNHLLKPPAADVNLEVASLETLDKKTEFNSYNLIITAGQEAAEHILPLNPKTHLLLTFISSQEYFTHLNEHYRCTATTCSFLFIDQPPARQFRLLRNLFPQRKTIGMFLDNHNNNLNQEYQRVAGEHGLKLVQIPIADESHIVDALQENISAIQVLLARPDPLVYNKNTAKGILLTTYYNKVPLLAYSRSFVKSGATAGLFSSIDDLARHAAEIANARIHAQRKIPRFAYPKYFQVEINKKVSDSMKLNLPTVEQTMEALRNDNID